MLSMCNFPFELMIFPIRKEYHLKIQNLVGLQGGKGENSSVARYMITLENRENLLLEL